MKRGRTVADFGDRIWNADETGFCLGSSSKKILARRGDHSVHEVGGASDHQFITVNACGNAAGIRLPPFVLYKGKNLYDTWTKGGPAGAGYSVSPSGWMEEINYLKWFEAQFYPAVKHLLESGPVVLFLDGHFSHAGIDLIMKARSLGIHLFRLPPNTTHLTQPLDIGVFGPMKQRWRLILKRYKLKTRAHNVTKQHFPELIKQLWESSFTPEHLQSAFRAAGLVPFNPSVKKDAQLAPSLPTLENQASSCTANPSETPLRVELRGYFVAALKLDEKSLATQKRRKIKLTFTGEVLTNDEVLERLQEQEAERAKKRTRSRRQKQAAAEAPPTQPIEEEECEETVYCGGCKQRYRDEEAENWVGCDNCDSWWHFWCADFEEMPREEEEWVCEVCKP